MFVLAADLRSLSGGRRRAARQTQARPIESERTGTNPSRNESHSHWRILQCAGSQTCCPGQPGELPVGRIHRDRDSTRKRERLSQFPARGRAVNDILVLTFVIKNR